MCSVLVVLVAHDPRVCRRDRRLTFITASGNKIKTVGSPDAHGLFAFKGAVEDFTAFFRFRAITRERAKEKSRC